MQIAVCSWSYRPRGSGFAQKGALCRRRSMWRNSKDLNEANKSRAMAVAAMCVAATVWAGEWFPLSIGTLVEL